MGITIVIVVVASTALAESCKRTLIILWPATTWMVEFATVTEPATVCSIKLADGLASARHDGSYSLWYVMDDI